MRNLTKKIRRGAASFLVPFYGGSNAKSMLFLLLFMVLGFDMLAVSIFRSYAGQPGEQKIIHDGKSLLMSGEMEHVVRRKNKLAFQMKLNPTEPQWNWQQQYEIFVMNADGSDLQRLTFTDVDTDNGGAKWIDDRTIAFARYRRGTNKNQFFKINIDDMNEEGISEDYYRSIK